MTDEQETNHAFARSLSNAGLAGCDSEWIIYLKETGKYESYDAMCECHRCRGIRENFECWKPANVKVRGTESDEYHCKGCGMTVEPGEYHPYAACLMFKACQDSATVEANLDSVVNHGYELGEMHIEAVSNVVELSGREGKR